MIKPMDVEKYFLYRCSEHSIEMNAANGTLLREIEKDQFPECVSYRCNFYGHNLTSFRNFPKYIGQDLVISQNNFTSFKDIDKHIKFIGDSIYAYFNKFESGFSDLFGVDGLQFVYFSTSLDRSLPHGKYHQQISSHQRFNQFSR